MLVYQRVIIHQKRMKNPKMSSSFASFSTDFCWKKPWFNRPAPASSHAAWPLLEASHASVAAGPLGWTPLGWAWSTAGNPHREGVKTWISMKCWVYGGSTWSTSLPEKSEMLHHFWIFLDRLKMIYRKIRDFRSFWIAATSFFFCSAWWTGSVKSK